MSALLDLALRCEAADGADRLLDAEIAIAIDLHLPFDSEWGARRAAKWGGAAKLAEMGECHQNVWRDHLPRYTASLDAAMGLKPDECWGDVGHRPDGSGYAELLGVACATASAPTPALALCAAALRVRASVDERAERQDGEAGLVRQDASAATAQPADAQPTGEV